MKRSNHCKESQSSHIKALSMLASLANTYTCFGSRTSCIAALSTYICDSSTSGYSEANAVTRFLHKIEACIRENRISFGATCATIQERGKQLKDNVIINRTSKTLALSTEHSLPPRFRAVSKATRAILSI